jgi:hypothetical protein
MFTLGRRQKLGLTLPSYILFSWPASANHRRHFSAGGIMSKKTLYRAERCRDLAEECRHIAAMCDSAEMRDHYSRMSEHYSTLAEAEELGAIAHGA